MVQSLQTFVRFLFSRIFKYFLHLPVQQSVDTGAGEDLEHSIVSRNEGDGAPLHDHSSNNLRRETLSWSEGFSLQHKSGESQTIVNNTWLIAE